MNNTPRVIAFLAAVLLIAGPALAQPGNVGQTGAVSPVSPGSLSVPTALSGVVSGAQSSFAPGSAPNISRPSRGGARVAAPINNHMSTRYNIKAGPVQMHFNAGLGGAYNTNVDLSEEDPQPDFVLTPRIGMGLYWPVTKLNTLRLDLGLGYNYYLNQPELGGQTLLVSPTTELIYNFYIKDVRVTLFERPSVAQNSSDDPTVSNAVDYTFLNNVAGFNVEWDLNDVLLGVGFANQLRYALNDEYSNENSVVNQVFANASFLLQPYLRVGLEGSASTTSYTSGSSSGGEPLNDNINYTLGLFAMGNLTRYTVWSAGVGWQIIAFNESNNSQNTGNASNPYFYLNVSSQLNSSFTHSFSASFESAPSVESNFVQALDFSYGFNWTLINNWSLGGGLFFQNGTESPGPESEDYNRLGANLSLGYQVMKNLFASVYYSYIVKTSSQSGDAYDQQILGLNLNYTF